MAKPTLYKKVSIQMFNQEVEELYLLRKRQELILLLLNYLSYSKLNTLVSECNQLY